MIVKTIIIIAIFLFGCFIVGILVSGVLNAKKNGTYLTPDNPLDYVKSADDLVKDLPVEKEVVNPEEEDAA